MNIWLLSLWFEERLYFFSHLSWKIRVIIDGLDKVKHNDRALAIDDLVDILKEMVVKIL